MLKINIPENWAEKHPPQPLFCLFVRDLTHVAHVELVPILQIHTQIPPI